MVKVATAVGLMLLVSMSVHGMETEFSGAFKASFGGTEYLDFVEGGRGSDADFDATREMGLTFEFVTSETLKGVLSFQVGEGSTGGYFGSPDALVGGEEDGDLIWELDNLYIDFTVPQTSVNFKVGSQGTVFADALYGSNIMYEVPPGVVMTVPFSETAALKTSWFRMTDLLDDAPEDLDDQADLFYAEVPLTFGGVTLTPYGAFATIGETVVERTILYDDEGNIRREVPTNYWTYSYFNYPAFIQEAAAEPLVENAMPVDNVNAYYGGLRWDLAFDRLLVRGTATYGDMEWETARRDINISGFFTDMAISYETAFVTPELFGMWGSGTDADDEDLDMMPPLIGGPTYTSSFFGGSRFNDNMFDSHDTTYATGMWAVGFKLKAIRFGDRLSNEFQAMYAEGTAEDRLFEAPDDILLNEDESFIELNFNSEYQIMKNLLAATEFGYIVFDEDSDYNEADGAVENFWKAAFALEYYF